MNFDFLKIIEKIQKNITCPICKRHFSFSEIKIKYILEEIIVFCLSCGNNHSPVQTIHVVLIDKYQTRSTNFQEKDINLIHKQIDKFDGDFIKLWKQ